MRILICNSKNWFSLEEEIHLSHNVKEIFKKENLTKEFVEDFQPDLIFFVHWNWIVDKDIHGNFECVVFHTAPLPHGRGGSPIQNLILDGHNSAPVCALKMVSELDAGPVYCAEEVTLSGDLSAILSKISAAINKLILDIIVNKPKPKAQEGLPHVYKSLVEADNEIPMDLSLDEIYDRVRMLDHEDYPNAFIHYGKTKLEFSNAVLNEQSLLLKCKITKLK